LKSKRYLLDLAQSLTCYKHQNFHVPEIYDINSDKTLAHESSKIQERSLVKKVKRSVGWEKFNDVFMVSAIHSHGSADIRVSFLNLFVEYYLRVYITCV